MFKSSPSLGILITICAAALFGIWPSASRAVYADGGNAAFVFIVSTALRCLPMLVVCGFKKEKLFRSREEIRSSMIGGLFQALSSSFAFFAVIFLPGPLAVVILFTHTLMLLAYMIVRGEAKFEATTLLTTASALAGLVFVLDLFHKQSSGNLIGIGLAFLSALAISTRLYVYGHQTKVRYPAAVGAENFLIALFFAPLVALFQTPHLPHSLAGYGWVLLGSVTLAFGTLGQFYAIGLIGSFRYSLFLKLEPVFTTLFAALLIGEYLRPSQYFGIALVIGSLAIYQFFEHRRNRTTVLAVDTVVD